MTWELVLCFHGIGTPPAHIPEAEVPYWASEHTFTTFISDVRATATQLGIEAVITVDDGNRSDLDIAAPHLQQNMLKGLFFPCVGRFGRPEYLGPTHILDLAAQGFEIGSQGIDHVPWTTLSPKELQREIAGSKAAIEDVLGSEVRSAAIPFGAYNRRVLAALRTAGYATVYSSDRGFSRSGSSFRRRWTYHTDEPFDIARLAAVSGSLRHRLITSAKVLVKGLR
jgi:peptidoglycan/xylan/chitin deacetylase (PgdA/CDA1 family)